MSRYQGWDMEEMKAAQAAEHDIDREPKRTKTTPSSSPSASFTPINRPISLSNQPQNVSGNLTRAAHASIAAIGGHPSRNPVVACYLGLDDNVSTAYPPNEVQAGTAGIEAIAKAPARKIVSKGKQKANSKKPISDGRRAAKSEKKASQKQINSRYVQKPVSRLPGLNDMQPASMDWTPSEETNSNLNASRLQPSSVAGSGEDMREPDSALLPACDRIPVIAHVTSLDAVKAQQGPRCSVYVGSSPAHSSQTLLQGKHTSTQLADVNLPRVDVSLAARVNASSRNHEEALQVQEPDAPSAHTQLGQTTSPSRPACPTMAFLPCRQVLSPIEEIPEEEEELHLQPDTSERVLKNQELIEVVLSPLAQRKSQILGTQPSTTFGAPENDDDFDTGLFDEDLLGVAARCGTPDPTDADSLPDLDQQPRLSKQQGAIQQLPTPLPTSSLGHDMSTPAVHDDADDWAGLLGAGDAEFIELVQGLESNETASGQQSSVEPAKAVKKRQTRIYNPKTTSTPFPSSPPNAPRTQTEGDDASKPIVRPSFPRQVQDRSPIIGLSATTLLRTCFRVGEALNVGCQAAREGRTVIIEFHATVRSSFREPDSVKQHFVFGDLFHDRPPYINGVYELWKGVELWDYDSSRFLEQGDAKRMCRCIGKMKREDSKWKMLVLNIWEASWEDINYVKGIVCT